MSTELELAVSHLVHRAHLYETMVHDSGPWYIQVNQDCFPALRVITQSQVRISAPVVNWRGVMDVNLYCRDVLVDSRKMEIIEDVSVEWKMSALANVE